MKRLIRMSAICLALTLLVAVSCFAGETVSVKSALLYPVVAVTPNSAAATLKQTEKVLPAPQVSQAGVSSQLTASVSSAPAPVSTGSLQQNHMTAAPAASITKGSSSEVDTTNKDNAYIKVRYTAATTKRVKVKIEYKTADGKSVSYSYDLNTSSNWETFPLQMGNGKYSVKVMENIEGTRYAVKQTVELNVTYKNPNAPYLIPMQLINYTQTSKVVAKAAELCAGKAELAKVEACYKWVTESIKYDYDKAKQIKDGQLTGYVPSVDVVFDAKKGICFDYSSVLAAMLRSQGIPTKLTMGYVPTGKTKTYHAWNEVFITGQGWVKINAQIYFDGKNWSRMDSTFSASGDAGEFIGDGSNYAKDKEY